MENPEKNAGSRILVIDDEEIVHLSLKRILGRQGFEVENAMHAHDGLKRINRGGLDLIITDLMMPEMNGIELLEELSARGCSIPVLMITGYPSIRTALQAMRLGAVDYLPKPFTREELLAPVRRNLNKIRDTRCADNVSYKEDEGIEAPPRTLKTGDRFHLRDHAWALSNQDGSIDIGIEECFLGSIGEVEALTTPTEGELIEQGHPGFQLHISDHENHSVFMPLSGQVHAVNHDQLNNPAGIDGTAWLIRIVPNRLDQELKLLLKG